MALENKFHFRIDLSFCPVLSSEACIYWGFNAVNKYNNSWYNSGVAIERHRFPEGEEPEVLTSISEECQAGRCEQCPGVFHLEDYGDQPIFCVHWCHEAPARVV